MTDQRQTEISSSVTEIASIINPDQGDTTTLVSHTQHKKESLATTIKNTMRLGIQEMTDTFSRALVSRTEHDANASYKITMSLVNFEKELIEARKPLS
ncbi:MAG: hypothetical protein NZL83_03525 [Candidatus Absconditabacterales bacterium]|nr:hypothetical protein [Candidatus Absconditabacterales bacterium]